MSFEGGFRIDLTPAQVVELAKQLPGKEKDALLKSFERERTLDRLQVMMEALKDVDMEAMPSKTNSLMPSLGLPPPESCVQSQSP